MNSNLKVQPYPYQEEGIAYGLAHKRLLIGDECGLGKTIQGIGIINAANAFPCLVVCPSSLKINWQREWEKFTDKKALVLDESTRTSWPYLLEMGMYHVAIVNYESIQKYFVWGIAKSKDGFSLKDITFCPHVDKFKAIIVDESHRCKNSGAAQSKFVKGIAQGKEWIILLSGTPVINNLGELAPQLSIMGRLAELGGKTAFYTLAGSDGGVDAIRDFLYKTCLIRRKKADVLTQLPEKTRVDLYTSISNMDEYNLIWEDLERYLKEYKECTDSEIRRKMRMKAVVRFMNLRAAAARGKIASAVDFIQTMLDSGVEKLIVFATYHSIIDELKSAFPYGVSITGRESVAEKQAAIDAFQNDPDCPLIFCGIRASGVGITLTAASNVLFVELPYTYADCVQAEDRAHRISQKNNVTCYYLLGRHTIDQRLYNLIYQKRAMANELLGDGDEILKDERYFEELMNEMLNGDEK